MRLNFLRALINQPDLLFLDEPTSGLDPVHAKKIKTAYPEQKGGREDDPDHNAPHANS